MRRNFFFSIIIIAVVAGISAQTPVELHGDLRVSGNKIVDKNGAPVQLRGMSFFWSQWMGQYYNKWTVDWLIDDWKVIILRAAMGVKHEESQSGYLYDASEKEKVRIVVREAIRRGIYVIIDWHDHFAFDHVKESKRFFEEMAKTYGKYPNVIYEIYNEPKQISWTDTVKPYSETIVKTIRAIDPDNLILIGTPAWCQDVDEAARNPLEERNLAYSLHFYAATHKDDIREKARYALDKGLALFVSEFGTCLASGNGYLDSAETENWFRFMDENSLSWCNWSIGDKKETASALLPGTSPSGHWKENCLTESGRMIRAKLRMYAGVKEAAPFPSKPKRESRIRLKGLD